MLACLWISITFGEPEIDDIHDVLFASDSDQKVIGFYVSMNEIARMNKFNAL